MQTLQIVFSLFYLAVLSSQQSLLRGATAASVEVEVNSSDLQVTETPGAADAAVVARGEEGGSAALFEHDALQPMPVDAVKGEGAEVEAAFKAADEEEMKARKKLVRTFLLCIAVNTVLILLTFLTLKMGASSLQRTLENPEVPTTPPLAPILSLVFWGLLVSGEGLVNLVFTIKLLVELIKWIRLLRVKRAAKAKKENFYREVAEAKGLA